MGIHSISQKYMIMLRMMKYSPVFGPFFLRSSLRSGELGPTRQERSEERRKNRARTWLDEIKLTFLLLSVYLSVLCSLGPFGAILSDLSLVRGNLTDDNCIAQNISKWPQATKSYKLPDPVVPIQSLYICINRAVRLLTQTVSLGCLWAKVL